MGKHIRSNMGDQDGTSYGIPSTFEEDPECRM